MNEKKIRELEGIIEKMRVLLPRVIARLRPELNFTPAGEREYRNAARQRERARKQFEKLRACAYRIEAELA